MPRFQLSLRYWCLTACLFVVFLGGVEGALRAEVIWQLPLGVVLQDPTDLNAEAVWSSYQPARPAAKRVLMVGASTAQASMDLPADGTSKLFAHAVGGAPVEYRSLCTGGGGYAEYLALVENAIAHGFRPNLVVIYTWPAMLTMRAANRARAVGNFLPLVSRRWLDALERRGDLTLGERIHHWMLAHSSVVRHRYYLNGWLRRRLTRLVRRDFDLEIPYNESRYRFARDEPLEQDAERFEQVGLVAKSFRADAAESTGLVALLDYLKSQRVRAVLIETPRSPPARRLLAAVDGPYHRLMREVAARHDALYVDPNDTLSLTAADFADLYHVSWDGRAKWLAHLVPTLARLML